MGYWLLNNEKRHQRNKLQYFSSLNEIFIVNNNSLTQWYVKESSKATINPIPDSQEQCSNLPSGCIPVEKVQNKYKYYKVHYISKFTQQIPSSFIEYFMKHLY